HGSSSSISLSLSPSLPPSLLSLSLPPLSLPLSVPLSPTPLSLCRCCSLSTSLPLSHSPSLSLPLPHSLSPSQPNEFEERATKKVDDLLESYMGIRDLELGKQFFTCGWSLPLP